jgi:hypothetical protein
VPKASAAAAVLLKLAVAAAVAEIQSAAAVVVRREQVDMRKQLIGPPHSCLAARIGNIVEATGIA